MSRKLAILGASGHGKVVADAAECAGWSEIVFYDDAWPNCSHNGVWPVVGTGEELYRSASEFDAVIVAIGDNSIRFQKCMELIELDAPLGVIVHPLASVSKYADLAPGTVVFAGAVVNPGATTGFGCVINSGAVVDHDCSLGNAVHVSPGACLAGGVSVGDMSWIGIGASIRQCIVVGERTIVGAGAVVVKNVGDGVVVVGVPAHDIGLK